MELTTLWFILIAILYTGFFVLEGFDFGVGILMPFLSKDRDASKADLKRRVIINTIGPHWDGNEVWLLTAGGATFAAFPNWYATLFSGFYFPLFLLLLALILRGVALEFRSKDENPTWRRLWDGCIFVGSLLPPVLLGVAFANLVRGVPIDADMHYVGGFFNLLNPFALLAGVAVLALFTLHGALFLKLKTVGDLRSAAQATANKLWLPVVVLLGLLLVSTYFATDILSHLGFGLAILPVTGLVAALLCGYFLKQEKFGWAFLMTVLTIVLTTAATFLMLYPRVMISSLNPAWSLTIQNASSSPYTLTVMSIIALVFVPIVLAYQAWSYWIFRKRLEPIPEKLTY